MNDRIPPKIATWLMKSLGYLKQNPALEGDLLEEFRTGARSTGWYWRQTAVVIATNIRKNAWGLLGEFAILCAVQVLIDLCLWRSRAQVKVGKMDAPAFLSVPIIVGFFVVQFLRKKPIGGIDASTAILLYVVSAPWTYVSFPNDWPLVTRLCFDLLPLALIYSVASLPARGGLRFR
jgi:hypothetical protein